MASNNSQDIRRQLETAGVDYIEGLASFCDSGDTSSLFVSKKNDSVETVKVDQVLIATGSSPFRPGGIPFDGKRVFDSDSINQVREFIGNLPPSNFISLVPNDGCNLLTGSLP